ncbi:MAG: DUF2269 family protein [Acidimicrobiia bacterium]
MPILATYRDGVYDVFLLLHIMCAIIGFGAVYLNALYGQEVRKRPGPEGLAVFEANFRVSKIAEYFIYAVFVFGLALLGLAKVGDEHIYKFSQTWVWLSIVLYIVGIGISHGVLMPSVKKMGNLMREMIAAGPPTGGPPPQAAQMQELGKKVGAAGATLDVLLIVIVALMIWKPGV